MIYYIKGNSIAEVWEVKPNKLRHILDGEIQLKNYTNGKWKRNQSVKLRVGSTLNINGLFFYSSRGIKYKVTYRSNGNGIITHDYKPVNFAEVVIIAVVGTLALLGDKLVSSLSHKKYIHAF